MAASTYSVTTASSDLSEIWRKVQYGIVTAFNFGIEEWNLVQSLKEFQVNWSAREITMELDIYEDTAVAAIPEGGKEARPNSPTAVTATLTYILLNKRFTISKTAQYIQQQQGNRGQLTSQLKWQSKKAVQAIRRKIGDMFYGFSSGTLAKVSSVATDDVVLKDMYGLSGEGTTTDDRRCEDLFRVGDTVCFLNPTGPALRNSTNSFQTITAITPSTNTITCTASSVSGLTANDLVVMANNLEVTTMAGGSERNLNLVGLLDIMTSTSVHSVSGATYAEWNASLADTSGGRFTGVKLRKMKQAIENNGGGMLNQIIWSNGVENDVFAQVQAGLRYSNPWSMEIDGKPTSKGISFFTSRRVPDGYVFGFDKSAICKMTLLPEPGSQAFSDGDKLQDDSGMVFSLDYPCAMVVKNRANTGYYSGVTEQ